MLQDSNENVLVSMETKFPITILKLLFTFTKLFRNYFMHNMNEDCGLRKQCNHIFLHHSSETLMNKGFQPSQFITMNIKVFNNNYYLNNIIFE